MISFESDYNNGAHPKILQRLLETNLEPLTGYGEDPYCRKAAEKIRSFFGCEDADVFFLTGGTQTNQVVIDTMLAPYQGVIAAKTGHIGVHEAGAIEFTGHKVIPMETENGKIVFTKLQSYLEDFFADESYEHMVIPGMVYISYPTEYGTLYTKKELQSLHELCGKYGMTLYIDGARLAYGLCSGQCDLTPPELAGLCDVFYIGGTKAGALCGEAVVFTKKNKPGHFMTRVKQHGALLAKGRLLGIQFDTLFTDDLYMKIGKHANEMAEKLKAVCKNAGLPFYIDSPTNQQFVILENKRAQRLKEEVVFSVWEKFDDTHTVARFATSWSTTEEDIEKLKAYFKIK